MTRDLAAAFALVDAVPAPVVLLEPGSARVLFANRASRTLADGVLAMPRTPESYGTRFRCLDAAGRRLELEQLPGVRAARGEVVKDTQVTWETAGGRHTFVASGATLPAPGGGEVVVMTYLEVTDRELARGRQRQASEELGAILEGVADSITAQAPDGRLVYANSAAVRVLGFESVEDLLSAPLPELTARWEMFAPDGSPFPPERLPGRRALLGEEPEPELVLFRDRSDGTMRWARVKARPVAGEGETVRLAINLIEDITELKQAEESSRLLAEASSVLAGSLDYEQTLAAIARLAVPEMADWCAVDLAVAAGLERVAIAHVDASKLDLAGELERRYPGDPNAPTGGPNVLRTGRSELYAEITDDMLVAAARDPEHLELIRALGMVSVMIVPMRVRERVLGIITFVSAEAGRRFTERDLRVAEDLGLRAASAVENARLYRSRSTIAQVLQASLLPPLLPDIPGLEAGALFQAAGGEGYEVGGDFYDLFSTTEDHWFAVIGDVCGKGTEAAAVTALVRYTIRAAAARRRSPAEILRWVNDAMLRQQAPRFCTVAVVHLDRSRIATCVRVALGGHPLPLILRADGSVEPVGVPGTLLGMVEQLRVEDAATELDDGDALLLYTDGVTEAGAPKVWTPEELEAALGGAAGRTAQEIVDHVAAAALARREAPPRDDVAMLALRVRPLEG